jgi:DNA invertase Pin-like site-specific DNA recombinase
MDLVAYVRASADGPADTFGLDTQIARIHSWARANGHCIIAVHEDAITSSTRDLAERPGLRAALSLLTPPSRATGLVVACMDRLARELGIQESILATIWRAGGTVFTTEDGLIAQEDPDDPMRNVYRQLMGAMAELDKDYVAKKLREGRRAKAARGMHSVGIYPYGYHGAGTGRDRDAAPQGDEQETIRRIVELRGEDRSYRDIAATLDAEGRRPRRADHWSPMAVRNIVLRHQGPSTRTSPMQRAE